MKRIARRVEQLTLRFGTMGITLLTVGLLTLFLLTRNPFLDIAPELEDRFETLNLHLLQLQQQTGDLDRLVRTHYDTQNTLIKLIDRDLARTAPLVNARTDAETRTLFQALRALFVLKSQALQHAQKAHAIAVNSYAVLPTLTARCLQQSETGGMAFDARRLFEQLLQLPFRGRVDEHALNALAARLNHLLTRAGGRAEACRLFLRHALTFTQNYARLIRFQQRAELDNVIQRTAYLENRFHRMLTAARATQKRLNRILLGATLLLALVGLFTLVGLERHARTLAKQRRELERLNRFYRALSEVNETIVTAADPHTLLQRCADILNRTLQLPGVSIFRPNRDTGWFEFVAGASENDEMRALMPKLRIAIDPSLPEGQGLGAEACRKGSVTYCNDYMNNSRFAPWKPLAQRFHVSSMAALPVVVEDRASLCELIILLYVTERNAFNDALLHLLDEIRQDIGYALTRLKMLARQKEQEAQLQLAEVAFNAREGIAIIDGEGRILRANDSLHAMLHVPAGSLRGKRARLLFADLADFNAFSERLQPDAAPWQGEIDLLRSDGTPLPASVTVSPVPRGIHNAACVLQALDLSEKRELERALERQRHTNPITGLPNRAALQTQLQTLLDNMLEGGDFGLCILLNLRQFKTINNSLGFARANQLLKAVAERLQKDLAFPHITAHNGADEFFLLPLIFYHSRAAAMRDWQRLLLPQLRSLFSTPLNLDGRHIHVEFYAGIAVFSADDSAEDVLTHAAAAMTTARSTHKPHAFYSAEMDRIATRELELRAALEEALAQNAFELHYQPVVDANTGTPRLVEALLRWRRDGELVRPDHFIPVLEAHPQLMIDVGRWVLRQGLEDLVRMQAVFGRDFGVAINLSSHQMNDPELETLTHARITELGLRPISVTLELTESTLVADLDKARSFISRCRGLGLSTAIDDFGTGYASLAYLQHFPTDKIKLDKAFIDPIDPNDPKTQAIPEAAITMAHALGARLIAEGVETDVQARTLAALGADMIQGYYYSRPLPLDDLLAYLQEHRNT